MLFAHDVVIDEAGWTGTRDPMPTAGEAIWLDEHGDSFSMTAFDAPPNLPGPLDDSVALAAAWLPQNGGNLGIEVVVIDEVPCVQVLSKMGKEPHGAVIMGAVIVPRRDHSYLLRLRYEEHGVTGVRETAVLSRMMSEGHAFPVGDGSIEGWLTGPPVPAPFLARNHADDEEWDGKFPDHPLTRCRAALRHLRDTTRFTPEFKSDPPFVYPPA